MNGHGETVGTAAGVDDDDLLRVKSGSDAARLARAISTMVSKGKSPRLRGIGASAVNQAVKAVIMARQNVISTGVDLVIQPHFEPVEGSQGQDVTAVTLVVTVKPA